MYKSIKRFQNRLLHTRASPLFLGNCGHFLRAASVQLAFLRDKFFVQEKLIIVHDFEIEVDRICSVQTWIQLLDTTILIKLANTFKT